METKTQTQQCGQKQLDLRELVDKVREKLRLGVRLYDGSVVYVNYSVYHFTYAKVRNNKAEVKYVAGCVSTHVDAVINDKDVEIVDVRLYNLCNNNYGV
jgi:hypothetical protein